MLDELLIKIQKELADTRTTCMTVAGDHEATVSARKEEHTVIAKATQILKESTGAAESRVYSLVQTTATTRDNIVRAVGLVKKLAHTQHSTALQQLSSRLAAVLRLTGRGGDLFAKVKSMIASMITKLETQASQEADEKKYCDVELSKTEMKKADLQDGLTDLSSKVDLATSASAGLQEDVRQLQIELGILTKEQAAADVARQRNNVAFVKAKNDLEKGLSGVQQALDTLRDYFASDDADEEQDSFAQTAAGDSFLQQPQPPVKRRKSSGAADGIIGILEVVSDDMAKDLATMETEESDEVAGYEKLKQENEVDAAAKTAALKHTSKQLAALENDITQQSSDRDTIEQQHAAVQEYYAMLKQRCGPSTASYEERKKRRDAEMRGLREALRILGSGDSSQFLERSSFGGHRRKGAGMGLVAEPGSP
jgi:hypothetical protein